MTPVYDDNGYRKTGTGWERKMPDGRTVQVVDRENPEWAKDLLAKLEDVR